MWQSIKFRAFYHFPCTLTSLYSPVHQVSCFQTNQPSAYVTLHFKITTLVVISTIKLSIEKEQCGSTHLLLVIKAMVWWYTSTAHMVTVVEKSLISTLTSQTLSVTSTTLVFFVVVVDQDSALHWDHPGVSNAQTSTSHFLYHLHLQE